MSGEPESQPDTCREAWEKFEKEVHQSTTTFVRCQDARARITKAVTTHAKKALKGRRR